MLTFKIFNLKYIGLANISYGNFETNTISDKYK